MSRPPPSPSPPPSPAAHVPAAGAPGDRSREALAAALEATDARYRALLERTGYGVYRSTIDGRIVDANGALAAMLGYPAPAALLALDLARDVYLDPHERARLLARTAEAEALDWMEVRWKRRDGTPITVRLAVRPIPDGEGGIAGFDGLVEDVTERLRHDELLRRSERMASLGTTLAGVAHELNNPLAAIMGFAQLLLKKPWSDDDRTALETINHEAERSAKIVRDLLTLARKRESERRAPINLNDVTGYILRTRRYALDTYGIATELRLDPSLPLVRGDRTQLEQVVLNLVTNAEQALRSMSDEARDVTRGVGAGARVAVRTWTEEHSVMLEVADNGPGIPDGTEWRIWDPFFTTREGGDGGGTGLGLSVVHSIVVEHGGTIEVRSAPGSGARFIVRLPALAGVAGDRRPSGDAPPERPLDVLVVDGDPASLSFVTRFLTSRGHAVLAAGDGARALRLASNAGFDAIICDASIVGEHPALLETIRGLERDEPPRVVIALSASERGERLDLSAPPVAPAIVVTKPYDVEALRRAIEEG